MKTGNQTQTALCCATMPSREENEGETENGNKNNDNDDDKSIIH